MTWTNRYVGTSQFPYAIDYNDILDMPSELYEWCEQQFGYPKHKCDSDDIKQCRWIMTITGVRFRKKEDQLWFVLKWS
jgi:hypothetical protein